MANCTCTGVTWNKRLERYWAYRPLPGGGRKSLGYHRDRADAEAAVERDRETYKPAAAPQPAEELSLGRQRALEFVRSLERIGAEVE